MRGDHPVRSAASPTVSPSIGRNLSRSVSRLALEAAVLVFQPHDVVELRRRDLEDQSVLQRRHAVDRAGSETESRAWSNNLGRGDRVARSADLDLRPALVEV